MIRKSYTKPQTILEVIRQTHELQEKFKCEINLDYLDKAIKILDHAIESTPQDHPSHEKYICERNLLHNKYPNVEAWLSGPRHDYKLNLVYIYIADSDEYEELDRFVIIEYLNEFNRKKRRNIQAFFETHKTAFDAQFDYAQVGFEGNRYLQEVYRREHWQDWVSIFLSQFRYPKMMASDEFYEIINAPPLDGDQKVYLPVRPEFSDNWDDEQKRKKDRLMNSRLLPLYAKNAAEDWDAPFAICELSSQLLMNMFEIGKMINTKEIENLDIKSFHFLVDKIHISDEMNAVTCEGVYSLEQWLSDSQPKCGTITRPKTQYKNFDLNEFQCFKGDRNEKIYAEIEVSREGYDIGIGGITKGAFIKLSLIFNMSVWNDLYYYEFWDWNPNAFQVFANQPLGDFLACFSDFHQDKKIE